MDKTVITITNSTDSIIDTAANGISKIFSHIGIPSLTLILVQICVILYMLYLRFKINQCMSMLIHEQHPPKIYREKTHWFLLVQNYKHRIDILIFSNKHTDISIVYNQC